MSPDIVLGWLKCAGYGLGLIIVCWVFLQKVQEREVIEIETAKDCRTCRHCADIDSLGYIHCTCPRFHSPGSGFPAKCRDYEREDEQDNCPTVTVSKISIAPDGTMSQTFEVNGGSV